MREKEIKDETKATQIIVRREMDEIENLEPHVDANKEEAKELSIPISRHEEEAILQKQEEKGKEETAKLEKVEKHDDIETKLNLLVESVK